MDTTTGVGTVATIVPASTTTTAAATTNDTTELTATSNDINVNQSNNNSSSSSSSSSAHITGDTGNSSSSSSTTAAVTAVAAGATTASSSNNGSINSNSNSSSSSSSTSSNSSGYGSNTTTPTNSNYETTQQQQQTPTPSRTPTTPVAIAEPIIPVATVAAVTPFYNEAITTHNLEIQHQQQQQQHHHQQQQQQQQQQHQLQQNLQQHQYLPRHQYYSPYDYQQQSTNLSTAGSATTTPYNMQTTYDMATTPTAATSVPYVGGQYKSSNLSAINYERNLTARPTAAATSYYHQQQQQQVQTEQHSKSIQNLPTTPQQQQFAKQRSSTSLITSSTNPNTSKPQAAATPFYAQPLNQPTNPSTYYDSLKHKMPLEYHPHHQHPPDNYINPTTATYHQQQKYYAAAKSQLKEATSYGSPGLNASKSLYPNPTNFYPSSTGNHGGLSSAAYDKYMYPHATATGYPSTSHLVNENPADTTYRKTAVANTLNSPSWPWGIEYASGNSRTIPPPPPTTHLPTATVAPTHATYLTPNPSALTRDPYYMAQDKYNMKYDKYSTAACPPSYQQSYVSPPATRHHMWPSSHGAQLNDRHHLAAQPSAPIPQHGLHSSAYYPTNSASALNARQSYFPQPYPTQSCYYPSPHTPSTRLSHNQPPAMAPNAGPYLTTQQPLGQTSHLNALSSSCKYGGVMADYGSGNKLKNPNDLYLPNPYEANNYGSYGSNQLYQPNAHPLPNQGSLLNHDSLAINSASYTNDLNLTSNFDNYTAHSQDSHIASNTFGGIHSQASPQYAPTVVKRALLDYRKPIQPQPPPVPQEELSYTTLTTASREHYQQQELLNTPENTTAFAEYDTIDPQSNLTYNQTSVEELETDKATEEANKNLSLRDFIANWNDDEDEYNNTEELNFGETVQITEVLQIAAPKPELSDSIPEASPSLDSSLKTMETKESHKLTEKLTEALNVNLPDIIIDIEKSNNVNNSITTPSTSPTSNIEDSSIILNNFDVEQELDELKKKKEDEKLEVANDINDIKANSGSSVTTPQLSPCKGSVTTQLSFEDLNLDQTNKTVLLTSRPDTSTTNNEQYFKDIEGYDSGNSRHSNESAFEKEYETFINKITSETSTTTKTKTNSDNSVKTVGETEIDFEQNVQDFSKFYKRKRKLKEDELKSCLSPNTQNKKKIKSASEEIVNNSNFPQVYTKKSRNRLLKHNSVTRKHKPLSFYYKIIHSLRRYRLYRIQRVRDYIAELKEKHLPLIKRQSIKNYSHAVQEINYQPKSLKTLTLLAINTTEFRQSLMLTMEESTENIAESEEKHICTDPSCETCEVIRSLMEPESFEDLKPSTESEEVYEIPAACLSTGIIYEDLPALLSENSEILLCETVNAENEPEIGQNISEGPIIQVLIPEANEKLETVKETGNNLSDASVIQVLIPETNKELKTAKETDEILGSLDNSSEIISQEISSELNSPDIREFQNSNQQQFGNEEHIIENIPSEVKDVDQNLNSSNSNQKNIEEKIFEPVAIEKIEDKTETDLENITDKLSTEFTSLIESENPKEEPKSSKTLSSPVKENLEIISNESPMSPISEAASPRFNKESLEDLPAEVEKATLPILKISELLKKSQNLESQKSPNFETITPEANKDDSNGLQTKIEKVSFPILKMSELLKKSQKFERKFSKSFDKDKNLLESNLNTDTNLSDDEDSSCSSDSHSETSDNEEFRSESKNQEDDKIVLQKDSMIDETSKDHKTEEKIVEGGLGEAVISIKPDTDSQAAKSSENVSKKCVDDNNKIFENEPIAKDNQKSVEVIEDDSEDSDSSDSDSGSSSNSSSDSDSDGESVEDDKKSAKLSTDKESSSDSDSESESEEETITSTENVEISIKEKLLPPSIEAINTTASETKSLSESVKESEHMKESENSQTLPSVVDNKLDGDNVILQKSPPTLCENTVKEDSKTFNIVTDPKATVAKSTSESKKDSDSEWDDETEDEATEIIEKSPKSIENIAKSSQEETLGLPKSVAVSENIKLKPVSNKNIGKLRNAKPLTTDTKITLPSSLEVVKNSDSDWNDESDEEITEIVPPKPTSIQKGLKLILKLKDIKSYQPYRKDHLQNVNRNLRSSESDLKSIIKPKLKEVGKSLSQTKLTPALKNKSNTIRETDSYSDFETETEDDNIYMECYNKPGQKSVQILRASQTLLQNNLELLHSAENSNLSQPSFQKSLDFFQPAEDLESSKSSSIVLSKEKDESMDILENRETMDNEPAKEGLNHIKSSEEPKQSVVEDAIIISDDEIADIPSQQNSEVPIHTKENNEMVSKDITAEISEESTENCEVIKSVESPQSLNSEIDLTSNEQSSEVEKSNEITENVEEKIDEFREHTENLIEGTNKRISQELSEKDDTESDTEFTEEIEDHSINKINTSVESQDSDSNEKIEELSKAEDLEQIDSNALPAVEDLAQDKEYPEVLDLSLPTSVQNTHENPNISEDSCSSERSSIEDVVNKTEDKTGPSAENLSDDSLPTEPEEKIRLNAENLSEDSLEHLEGGDISADHFENLNNPKTPQSPQELVSNMELSEDIENHLEIEANEIISSLSNSSKNKELAKSPGTTNEITEKLEDPIEELNRLSIVDDSQESNETIPYTPDSPEELCSRIENEQIKMETSELPNKTVDFKYDESIEESNEINPISPDSPEVASTTENEIAKELEELNPVSEFEGNFKEPQEVTKIIPDSPDRPKEVETQRKNIEVQDSPASPEEVVNKEDTLNTKNFLEKETEATVTDDHLSESPQDLLINAETSQCSETSSDFLNRSNEREDLKELESFEDSTARECSQKSPLSNDSISEPDESEEEEIKSPYPKKPNKIEALNNEEMTEEITEESIGDNSKTIENKISENMEEESNSEEAEESKLNENKSEALNISNNESKLDVTDADVTEKKNMFETSVVKDIVSAVEDTDSQLDEYEKKSINSEETFEIRDPYNTVSETSVDVSKPCNISSELSLESSDVNECKQNSTSSDDVILQATSDIERQPLELYDEESESNNSVPEAEAKESKNTDTFSKNAATMDSTTELVTDVHQTATESGITSENLSDESELKTPNCDTSEHIADELELNEIFSNSAKPKDEATDEPNNIVSESTMLDVTKDLVNELEIKETFPESAETTEDSIIETTSYDTFSEPKIKVMEAMEITSECEFEEPEILENISNPTEATENLVPEVVTEESEQMDSDINVNGTSESAVNNPIQHTQISKSPVIGPKESHIDVSSDILEEALTRNDETIEDEISECSEEDQIPEDIEESKQIGSELNKNVNPESAINIPIQLPQISEYSVIEPEAIHIAGNLDILAEVALKNAELIEDQVSECSEENQNHDIINEESEQMESKLNAISESEINKPIQHTQILESLVNEPEESHIDTNSDILEKVTTENSERIEDQTSECSEKDFDMKETILKEATPNISETIEDQSFESSQEDFDHNETSFEPTIKHFNSNDVISQSLDNELKLQQTNSESTETMDEESEINDTVSEPALKASNLNDVVTESIADEKQLNNTTSESSETFKDLNPEESRVDECPEIVQEFNESKHDRALESSDGDESETIDNDSKPNDVISEPEVNEIKLLKTIPESAEILDEQSLETLEENSQLYDNFSEATGKNSELSINALESEVDEQHEPVLKSSETIEPRNTESMSEVSELNYSLLETAINESKPNEAVIEPTTKDSNIKDITLETTIQQSLANETVLESITEDQIPIELTPADQISEDLIKVSQLNEDISQKTVDETEESALNSDITGDQASTELIPEDQILEDLTVSQLNEDISVDIVDETEESASISDITINESELDIQCSPQAPKDDLESAIKETDVSENISKSSIETSDLKTSTPNNDLDQTNSAEIKSDISQHNSTQTQPELLSDKENTTEDLSGDFCGFKHQSSFEEESEDFHGFEDIEEATRIRREMENLNEDSAANDGFLNSTLNKETKSTITSPTASTTSEINELEALEMEISQQHSEKQQEDENEKETDKVLINETTKIISTNDIEHIKKMLESDEEPQHDEGECQLKRDDNKSITSSDEITLQTKDVIKTITDSESKNNNDNDIFVENFKNISIDNINSVIPKLSDLCRAALNSSLNTNNLEIVQNVQDQIDNTVNDDTPTIYHELTVEEALAEMYRQAGVLLSDPEDTDNEAHRSPTNNCNEEAQDVLLINLQEILNSDNDVYVLQCDMNDLNVVQTNNENEDSTLENTERINTVQFFGILDTDSAEPQIHIISSDSESEVIILSDDCESDFEPITERQERVIIPFINDFDMTTDDEGNLSDISTIHHEEIVPDNLNKFLQEEFYKYLHEKYVQRNISKYYHANRVLKKYKKRFIKKSTQ